MTKFLPALPAATALAALATLAIATPAHADDTQAWAGATVNVAINGGPWRLMNETVVRTSDARGLYEVEDNLLLGYRKGQITAAAGYTHDPQYRQGNFLVMERRLRTQVQADNFAALGPVKLSGRMRLEARWRDGQSETGWRLRPFIRATLPVHGKTVLNLSTEPFIDLGRTAFQKVDGLERTRTQLSIQTPLNKHVSIEAGYLNQHSFVRRGADTDDHVASLALSANF